MKRFAVLVVDDDPDVLAITKMSLALDQALTVTGCSSGFQAMKLLTDSATHFDVLLLDMTLIDTTGLEIMAEINADPNIAIEVIFFTASVHRDAVSMYVRSGAIGVIAKPFDPLTLAAQVRDLIDGSNDAGMGGSA